MRYARPDRWLCFFKKDECELCNEVGETDRALHPGEENWRERGITPRMVLEFCRMNKLACAVVHNQEVIETLAGDRPILTYCVHENHCYFYSCPVAPRSLLARRVGAIARL